MLVSNFYKGVAGEEIVIEYLQSQGYQILHWRYKTPVGEIDIIACNVKEILFVEVKARSKNTNDIVSITQCKRVLAASEYYLQTNAPASLSPRFDVALVMKNNIAKYIPNAYWHED